MEDNWENLAGALPGQLTQQLHISERPNATSSPVVESSAHQSDVTKPPTPPPAESSPAQPQHQAQQPALASAAAPEYETVDAAILQALADPTQRVTVLKCEELVEKFLADPCQETLQFPASFSSYQRMLAHRVGQYYGLQTSTVDYEDSQGRVVAIRVKSCYDPKPRLRNLDVRPAAVAPRVGPANGMGPGGIDKPRLLRRQDEDRTQQMSSEQSLNQSPVRSQKERAEIYMKAREEFGLGSGPQDGMGRGNRGGPGGRFGNGGRMDGGRGRKAIFRDKDKDLSDPDYRRGMNRFNGAARFDPAYAAMPAGGIYQVPTYSSEFPALNRMPGGPATSSGRPNMPPQHHQPHGPHPVPQGAPSHPVTGPAAQQHQPQQGPGAWGQQAQQQGPGGVRPPPPPPPPHAGGGTGASAGGGGGGGPAGKAHHQSNTNTGSSAGAMGGRQHQQHSQQQQQQQQAAAYGPTMAAAQFSGVAAQYPVPLAVGAAGFMPGPHGQPVFGMTATGAAIPGAMYAAPAPGVSGAFYPGMGMGMGMGAVGMALPAAGAYGYVTAPAPGVGVGASGETIALAPQAAYPVYASYPAGAAVYPATSAQMSQATAMHHAAGGAAIPMRPVYGIPSFYPQYDPSQYAVGMHQQQHGQGEGRGGYGGYGGGGHHGQYGGHHGGHGGGRGRDSDTGAGRGEQQHGTGAGAAAAGPDGK